MGRRLPDTLYFDPTYYPAAASSCAFFLCIYKYISPKFSAKLFPTYNALTKEDQVDWNTRVNSTIHAVVVSCMCAYTFLYDDEITEEPIWWDAPAVRTSCAIVVGYMTADLMVVVVHYKQIGEVFYLFHHGASIYAYYYVTTYGVLPYFANYRMIAEVSTPFVNQRWFLLKLGYGKTSPAFVGNGCTMALTFFLVRIALMPSYWMSIYSVYNTPTLNNLGHIQHAMIIPSFVLDGINIYWFYKICAGAYKICSAFYNDKSKNESLDLKENNGFDAAAYKRSLVPNYTTESHKRLA